MPVAKRLGLPCTIRCCLNVLVILSFVRVLQADTPFGLPVALPVEIRVAERAWAFPGSDGQAHVAYEAAITNMDRKGRKLTLKSIEILDNANPALPLASFRGPELGEILQRPGLTGRNAGASAIGGGMRATVWLWLNLSSPASPLALKHRFVFNLEGVEGEFPVECCLTQLDQHALPVLLPPVHGGNWSAGRGPSNSSGHRRQLMAINGQLHDAQRFAIDWYRLDERGKAFKNNGKNNSDFYGYGADALAVADAVVADARDGIPENKPGDSRAVPIDFETVAGNCVVLDLGNGIYAAYAHLQPGSLRVKKGDAVRRGDVIGLVGNSGNSGGPHLHFHLMDSPSILDSEGIPYVLDNFALVGIFDPDHLKFHPSSSPTSHTKELPLENMVVSFP